MSKQKNICIAGVGDESLALLDILDKRFFWWRIRSGGGGGGGWGGGDKLRSFCGMILTFDNYGRPLTIRDCFSEFSSYGQ